MSLFFIIIRNIFFYISIVLIGLIGSIPGNIFALFGNKKQVTFFIALFASLIRGSLYIFVNVKLEIRGKKHLIKGPCIVASKHQSAFETTLFFNAFFPRIAYAMKREIKFIFPYLYFLYNKYDGVEVNRKDGIKALIKMEHAAIRILKEGRQFAIFPEGTRSYFGQELEFKRGILRIYKKANVPVTPVALNSGNVWPKSSFLLYPGKIIVEFLPAIPAGLEDEIFMQRLSEAINVATRKLEKQTPCNYYMKKQGICNKIQY